MGHWKTSPANFDLASSPHWIDRDGHALTPPAQPPQDRPFQFRRMVQRLPSGVRDTLTQTQLDAISDALIPDPPSHVIDYRVSIPFFGRRFYITLLAGRERRSLARLAKEAQIRAKHIAIFYSAVLLMLGCVSIIGFILLGYVVKSALDIDLMDGPSILHQFFVPGQSGMEGSSGMQGMASNAALPVLTGQKPET